MTLIIIIVLLLLIGGVWPTWPYSRGWGYGPSSLLGFVVVLLLILFLMHRI